MHVISKLITNAYKLLTESRDMRDLCCAIIEMRSRWVKTDDGTKCVYVSIYAKQYLTYMIPSNLYVWCVCVSVCICREGKPFESQKVDIPNYIQLVELTYN